MTKYVCLCAFLMMKNMKNMNISGVNMERMERTANTNKNMIDEFLFLLTLGSQCDSDETEMCISLQLTDGNS